MSTISATTQCYRVDEGRRRTTARVLVLVASYLLGGVSLLMWVVFLSRGGLQIVDLGLDTPGALLFDALLSLVFFTQHSVMVRVPFKGWMARRIRQEYQGAVYAVASGMALLVLTVFWQGPLQTYVVLPGIGRLLMHVVSLLALVGFIWGARSLGSFDMFGSEPILRLLRNHPPAEPMPLTIRGPYHWVRHPLYLCCLMAIWSVTEITVDRLLYNIMWTGWIVLGTMLEERDLVAVFGTAYREYAAKVPMLIPRHLRPMQSTSAPTLADQLCDGQSID